MTILVSQKFISTIILRSSLLEGTASKAMQGLILTDVNYDLAVELLQERFGSKYRSVSHYISPHG